MDRLLIALFIGGGERLPLLLSPLIIYNQVIIVIALWLRSRKNKKRNPFLKPGHASSWTKESPIFFADELKPNTSPILSVQYHLRRKLSTNASIKYVGLEKESK